MKRLWSSLAALLLLTTATACGDDSDDTNTLKIGAILSLTGNYAPLGSEDKKAVELAVQQINAAGGLLGRQIELLVRDDKSQPEQSVLSFNELTGSDVAAVIGSPFSNSALATIPQVDREKIPYVSLTPADEQVNPVHPYVYVVPATSATYADRILQYYQAQGYTKIAVAHDSRSSYANAGAAGTRSKASRYGITLVADEEFQTTTTEFSAILNHVKASGAQALTVWSTGAPAVAFAKQYATAGLGVPLMFTGSQASTLWLKPTGAAAEGVFVASSIAVVGDQLPAGQQRTAVEELSTPFTAQYGYPPPQFAADGYTGVKLLAAAVTAANSTDADKIRAAFEGLTLTTPNGTYHYSATDHAGLTADYISINVVKGGTFVATDWAKSKLAK
ncbi:branched-chain amino acid ABC transporter substrate-binding protein [Actinoplanes ianthinogenes]|uniref:Branched-chain amino acid ABC transporter substrate-binding protein n=1 Tax=Actinoplanes ianthinogenes TaxID=122358 RepID=A0ABM7LL86_9ACTN|nr:ABC transporter substrate-binding protein [Actinoplanes ianthinogenes]BCJ39985.1 branched-chain amino acid ABC transporter substrate-binding protein [Actinoplanes ianthinogenes]GGR09468.1 branched-chain amino acid ABC transporter substrate-binding protein [Actinoplanes ianthinogenes]